MGRKLKMATPIIAMLVLLAFVAPPQASAKIHFGVYLGAPAYPVPAYPYDYGYGYGYGYPGAYGAYGYSYPNYGYGAYGYGYPYYGGHEWREHEEHEWHEHGHGRFHGHHEHWK